MICAWLPTCYIVHSQLRQSDLFKPEIEQIPKSFATDVLQMFRPISGSPRQEQTRNVPLGPTASAPARKYVFVFYLQ